MKVPTGDTLLNPYKLLKDDLGVTPGQSIADLGCGTGFFTLQAAKLVTEDGSVHAVDILKDTLEQITTRAKMEKLENITTHWSDLETFGALNINDQTINAALLINTLFQNTKTDAIFNETVRLLKPGGSVLVVDWMPGRFPIGPHPQQKISPEEIQKHAIKAGLKERRYFQAGNYHFGIIFNKGP